MKKLEITEVTKLPTYFVDGSVVFVRGLLDNICESDIKTEFSLSEVRKLDKWEVVIKFQMGVPPSSKRLVYLKSKHLKYFNMFCEIAYEISEKDFTEEEKRTFPQLIHGELWDPT